MTRGLARNQLSILAAAGCAVATLAVSYYLFASKRTERLKHDRSESPPPPSERTLDARTPQIKNSSRVMGDESDVPAVPGSPDKKSALHSTIEQLDKKGKALFKNKQFLQAAEVFTEALDLIRASNEASTSLSRQSMTLLNNRSAMYEKAGHAQLAMEDCHAVLNEFDVNHTKARTRLLRLLESVRDFNGALVQVCALQLLFLQTHRTSLRQGLPVPPPPVSPNKLEELMKEILPSVTKQFSDALESGSRKDRQLPADYTIIQLLRSYSGYDAWKGKVERSGSVGELSKKLSQVEITKKADVLFKRGRRYMSDGDYAKATQDLEEAYLMVQGDAKFRENLEHESEYADLLEWTGMARHFKFNLEGALECYRECAEIDLVNSLVLVKQAGVHMDAGRQDEALKLFDQALQLDPGSVDALLHRANLRMLQTRTSEAKIDLEALIALQPNHVMGRLRLASILAAENDTKGAQEQLKVAERTDPDSSEVVSYRGEFYFTNGDVKKAYAQFEKAIRLEPKNPTPYVNAALALLNTPGSNGQPQMPDAQAVMKLLRKAIEVDPQCTGAYTQLGQLLLGTAVDLDSARAVIKLYDEGLEHARLPTDVAELCSMRTLAQAQVDAASMLGMETFNMQ